MAKVIHAAEFFVVGGPVQPDRLCYVERGADRLLLTAIRAKQSCCVLGPRGIGKSSLMHRAVRALRQARELAAVVDLAQINARADNVSAEQWAFSVAYKVAYELKLHVDLEAWWQEQTSPASERLADFFWAVVLTNTTAPITVFVDDIEAAFELPFARELLAAFRLCQQLRESEPDFTRLNFVLLGTASKRQLAAYGAAAFATAAMIEIGDFSLQETYGLAMGFGGELELAQALMDRVYAWTAGHPYLTQKVARGVARKGGKLEDVERVVREQLLAPGVADEDALLSHMRLTLTPRSEPARRMAKVLRKVAGNGRVPAPADVGLLEELHLSGLVVLDPDDRLAFRNRIFKELVGGQWLKGSRLGWKVAAAAAVLAVAAGGAALWYTQYLPVDDVATLTSTSANATAVDAAYRRLRSLPGFAERADELFLAALERQSKEAASLAAAADIDARLRGLPRQDALADQLMAEFWLRRARAAAHAEQRDAAALFARRAAQLPSAVQPVAAAHFAELISDDYPHLERSLRLSEGVARWHVSFADGAVIALDAEQRVGRLPLGANGDDTRGMAPLNLTALQHVALIREISVDGEGTAGELELTLALQHPAAGELLVTLAAPSGAQALVVVPVSRGETLETFVFPAAPRSALAALADEGRRGVWRLTVVDRRTGNAGVLAAWGLRFGDAAWDDAPAAPLAIPDPVRTEAVTIDTFGPLALVQPTTPGVVGAVALWNLAARLLVNDFTLPFVPRHVAVNVDGNRLVTATTNAVTLWNVTDGSQIARLVSGTEFLLPPVFSADGGYVAIAERVEDAEPLYSVLRATDASLVGGTEGLADTQEWQLGPGARYFVLTGTDGVTRVLELRRGEPVRRLGHADDLVRVLPLGDGATLLTVDAAGELLAWSLTGAPARRRLGTTASVASVSVATGGTRVAFATRDHSVAVVDVATGAAMRLRQAGALPTIATQLAVDGRRLVTGTAEVLRLWSLPDRVAPTLRIPDAAAPSALALDRGGDLVAVGLRSGQLQLLTVGDLPGAAASPRLEFFGHRGPITAIAVEAAHGLAATGGSDGIVRLWDLSAAAPTGVVMQPADEPVAAVVLSADGRWVASAAGSTVRVAAVADGKVTHEIEATDDVTSLLFLPDASGVVVGDAAGTVLHASLAGPSEQWRVQVGAAVTALAAAHGGEQLAVGDARGGVRLLLREDGAERSQRALPQPVRWLMFNADDSVLLLATNAWLHSFDARSAPLEPLHSRLAPRSVLASALVSVSGVEVRLAGPDAEGLLDAATVDLAAPPRAAAEVPALLARDWPTAFALQLDDNGEPAEFAP